MKEIWGLILCGGLSTRMGVDKSLISYYNKPQREHLRSLCKNFLPHTFLSVGKIKVPGQAEFIEDQLDIKSPLNGILSAFAFNTNVAWLVIACDMPLITSREIELLIEARDPNKLATCFNGTDNIPHPLFTIYEPHAFNLLKKHAETSLSPREFLKQNDVKIVPSVDSKFLKNINTQCDLNHFQASIRNNTANQ